jgi:murein DD-endopeptidase MepM/ murein hydrolase activator NlpD
LIPTAPLDKPGPRTLEIKVRDNRYKPVKIPCTIQKQSFETQHIWLSKKKSTLKKSKTEEAQVEAWQNLQTAEQLWNGPFRVPSTGVISSQYGQQRFYNGKFAKNYYHRGIDYAAPTGSPVSSPAAGKVVLVGLESRGFDLHGNCVGLDHGQGVASMFMHLDKVHVKVGAKVKQGQTLGTIGDTGIATGPHLHWGLFVHGQCVDPYMWFNKDKKQHRLLF